VNGSAQSGKNASTFSFVPASSGYYSIYATVTDTLDTTSAQSSAASVTVNPSPTLSIAPASTRMMDVGQVQGFTAAAIGGSGALSYQWYLDGATVGGNSATYSYTAGGSSHSITCKVTDSASVPVTSLASNTVSVTVAPSDTPTPTPTPAPTSSPTATPTPTPNPTLETTPAPTPLPSPSPNPSATAVPATTKSGATIDLTISGNITLSQMHNVTISTDQSAATTTVSFNVTGQNGTTATSNMAIPKSAVPYGKNPIIYIDNQPAQNQGYCQDNSNYYVWYTIHFSTHKVSIFFTITSPSPNHGPQPNLPIVIIYEVTIVLAIIGVATALLIYTKSKKQISKKTQAT
jgi:hypothetical protein